MHGGGLSPSCPPAAPQLSTLPGTLQPKQDSTHVPGLPGDTGASGRVWVGNTCVVGAGGLRAGRARLLGGLQGYPAPLVRPAALPAVPEMETSCHALPLADTARGLGGSPTRLPAPREVMCPGAFWHISTGAGDAPAVPAPG